jgi:hypothetical protein
MNIKANIIIIGVLAMSLLAFVQDRPYWPFIPYDMYCAINARDFTVPYLLGTTSEGQSISFDLWTIFRFKDRSEFVMAVRKLSAENPQQLTQVLGAIQERFTAATGKSLTDLKLYFDEHAVESDIDHKYKLISRTLVGEFKK